MASAQRLRELVTELRRIRTSSTEAKDAVDKLSRELTLLADRADRLKGHEVGKQGLMASAIGGSEAELEGTKRSLEQIITSFARLQIQGSGAFNRIIADISNAITALEIYNQRQRDLVTEEGPFHQTTYAPESQRYREYPVDPQMLSRISEYLKNVQVDSLQGIAALRQFAEQLDIISERAQLLAQHTPGKWAPGGWREKVVGFTEQELNDLERGLRLLENLGGEYKNYAAAVREVMGAFETRAASQRKFLDQLGFREIGVEKLRDLIQQIENVGTTAEQATQEVSKLQQATMEFPEPTIGPEGIYELPGQITVGAIPAVTPPEEERYAWTPLSHVARYDPEAEEQLTRFGEDLVDLPPSFVQIIQAGKQLDTSFRAISGTAEQLGNILRDNNALMRAVQVGVNHLGRAYKDIGVDVNRFTVEVDAANDAIRVQAEATDVDIKTPEFLDPNKIGATAAEIANISDSIRVGIGSGQITDRAKELERAFKNIGASSIGVKNLEQELGKFGLTLEDIRGAYYDGNEQIIRFNASADAGAGIMRRASVVMDRNGQIVETVKQKYEGFGAAISNSINKVIRWGIAVGLVYGSMRRLRSAIDEMIGLQTAFADIQIITGRRMEELGTALDSVVEAAEATGTTLADATSAFEKALRAAGRTADETERLAKAEQLMTDTLVLARLANISQTQAIDMLTGALRQAGLEIDQGQVLLDKWVRTSKTAFVSLEDLAESFAITAAQATAVGVDIDHLNGIIGTIAEVTTLSASEIGNLGRTMLSALESDAAVKSLREFGVAVEDTVGEFRDWGDVIQDVFDLYRTEAISERELAAIGRALGGGARRGPQIVAFIKEFGRVNEIAAESQLASGEAADALDIKMDTLQNTVNRLQVALSKLAVSLGTEGGLLEFMTSLVELTTKAINILDSFTGTLGSTTTQIIALAGAYSILTRTGALQRISARLTAPQAAGTVAAAAVTTGPGYPGLRGPAATEGIARSGSMLGRRAVGVLRGAAPTIGTGIGVGVLTAMTTGSVVQGVGAGIGGAIGSVLGGPVGTLAGAAIGSVIGQQIEESARNIRDYMDIIEVAERGDVLEQPEVIKGLTVVLDKQRNMFERFGDRGPEIQIGGETRQLLENWRIARPEDVIAAAKTLRQSLIEDIEDFTARGLGGTEWPQMLQKEVDTIDNLISQFERNEDAIRENTEALERPPAPFAEERARIRRRFAPGLQQRLEEGRAERVQQFAAGEIPRAAYTRYLEVAERLPIVVTTITQLLGDQMVEEFGRGQSAFEELGMALADLDPAAIEWISDRLERVTGLRSEMDALASSTTRTVAEMELAVRLEEEFAQLAVSTSEEILAIMENARAAAAEPIRPSFVRLEDLGQQDFNQIYRQAIENQNEYARFVGLTSEDIRDAAEDWVYVLGDRLGTMSGLWKVFFDDALQAFKDAQQQLQEEQFHVRRLQDVSPERFGEIQARNRYWIEFLARLQGMTAEQYLAEEGFIENLILGPNNVWQKILTTSEAMAFTLQDILETEKKQLEGMWNIPEGATFWVPLTSLFYQRQEQGGGVPQLPPIDQALIDQLKEAQLTNLRLAGMFAGEEVEEPPQPRRRMAPTDRGARPNWWWEPTGARTTEDLSRLVEVVEYLKSEAAAQKQFAEPEQFYEYVAKLAQSVQAQEDSLMGALKHALFVGLTTELKQVLPDVTEDKELTGLLLEAANQLLDSPLVTPTPAEAGAFIEQTQQLADSGIDALGRIAEWFAAPLDAFIDIQLEAAEEIIIRNVISLDGAVIKRYVDEYLARVVGKAARASGATATLKG